MHTYLLAASFTSSTTTMHTITALPYACPQIPFRSLCHISCFVHMCHLHHMGRLTKEPGAVPVGTVILTVKSEVSASSFLRPATLVATVADPMDTLFRRTVTVPPEDRWKQHVSHSCTSWKSSYCTVTNAYERQHNDHPVHICLMKRISGAEAL